MTELCIKQPQQRMNEIQNLMETMLQPVKHEINTDDTHDQAQNSLEAIRDLVIDFQGDPVLFEGKELLPLNLLVTYKERID